jgi:hypothetical protein
MAEDRNQVFDSDGNLLSEEVVTVPPEEEERRVVPDRLRNSFALLRQWADEAETTYANWPTMTNAQKDASNRAVVLRFGKVCDGLADLLVHLRANQ